MKTFFISATAIVALLLSGAIAGKGQTLAVKEQLVEKLQLTEEDVRECGGVSKVLSIKSIDLNRDRSPEFIVNILCPLELSEGIYVLRKTAGGVDILYEGGAREFLTPLKTYTNGWRNIRSFAYSAGSGESGSVILRWSGDCYSDGLNPCPN